MSQPRSIINVGAQDPEQSNSPITGISDEDFDVIRQDVDGESVCYFNNQAYPHNTYVHSGTYTLVCDNGLWVSVGSGDPDNV